MTDRIRTLHVTLDRDVRDDDIEVFKQAIGMIKGVAAVENGPVVGVEDYLARQTFAMNTGRDISDLISLLTSGVGDSDGDFNREVKALLERYRKDRGF